jgi:hypothetical protein
MDLCTGFFAYSSVPPSCGDAIESAVQQINISRECEIRTWKSMNVGGREVVHEICNSIDQSDFFCADITGLSPNVLFELGYAIAKNKRIWLLADTSFPNTKQQIQSMSMLTTIGHDTYTNAAHIINAFYNRVPHKTLEASFWKEEVEPTLESAPVGTLLHLKPLVDDQAALVISQAIKLSKVRCVIDDPRETQSQTLSWYGQQLYRAAGLLCHFTGPSRTGAIAHNARLSLVCGVAHGLGKSLLMLTEENFLAPFDYRVLLHHYHTSQDAQAVVSKWIPNIQKESANLTLEFRSEKEIHEFQKGLSDLQELKFGEYMAENEPLLDRYFVETPEYDEAKNGTNHTFVGRKGTGKTANLLRLAADLKRDPNNLVVIINPEGYQMDGLVRVLKKYVETGDKSFVVETLWKFLLYTELANEVCEELEASLAHGEKLSAQQQELLEVLGSPESDFRQEFAIRLERTVQKILAAQHSDSVEAQRYAIGQSLHKEILSKLKRILPSLLVDRSVAILVDNLDKAWDPFVEGEAELQSICKILLGLLTSVRNLDIDFDKGTKDWRRKRGLKTSIAAFLRADIYHKVLEVAPEPDKMQPVKLRWNDLELLGRVIEERMLSSIGKSWTTVTVNAVWTKFFPSDVNGIPTKDYILHSTLPRPRDVICMVKFAVGNAIKRKRQKVWPVDLVDANRQYSEFAISTISAEYPHFGDKLQYEFMGSEEIMNHETLTARIVRCGCGGNEVNTAAVIENLISLSFLGVETAKDVFRFAEDPEQYKKLEALAGNYTRAIPNQPKRYSIHKAFQPHLEVTPTTNL